MEYGAGLSAGRQAINLLPSKTSGAFANWTMILARSGK
jgi:hypothetical protein